MLIAEYLTKEIEWRDPFRTVLLFVTTKDDLMYLGTSNHQHKSIATLNELSPEDLLDGGDIDIDVDKGELGVHLSARSGSLQLPKTEGAHNARIRSALIAQSAFKAVARVQNYQLFFSYELANKTF